MRKRRADKIQTNQVAKKDKQRKIWRGKERGRESARDRLSESMSSWRIRFELRPFGLPPDMLLTPAPNVVAVQASLRRPPCFQHAASGKRLHGSWGRRWPSPLQRQPPNELQLGFRAECSWSVCTSESKAKAKAKACNGSISLFVSVSHHLPSLSGPLWLAPLDWSWHRSRACSGDNQLGKHLHRNRS